MSIFYYLVVFFLVVLLFSSLAFLDLLVREGLALNELELKEEKNEIFRA